MPRRAPGRRPRRSTDRARCRCRSAATAGRPRLPGRGSLSSRWGTEQLRAGLDRALPGLSKLAAADNKPLALLEYGTREEPRHPGRKARWIAGAARDLEHRYPEIDAAAWWNEAYNDSGERVDLRIDSTPSSLRAYRRLVSGGGFATGPRFGSR